MKIRIKTWKDQCDHKDFVFKNHSLNDYHSQTGTWYQFLEQKQLGKFGLLEQTKGPEFPQTSSPTCTLLFQELTGKTVVVRIKEDYKD